MEETNICNYWFFQRLLSAFHNCSRSLLHLLSNSGSYQWPAQAQPFWLRNHVFFHSMNHVQGFGFQQCSLRLRKPKLVERELPAERLVSFCSYLEKLQALQIPNRWWEICLFWNANTTRTWTSSNNLLTQTQTESLASNLIRIKQSGTYLPVAGCCGVAASRATYVWDLRKSCESPISKTRNTPFQSLLVNLIDWLLPQMPGGKHQCFMILRSLSAAKAPATCKSHDMTYVQSISWFGVNSKLKSHLHRTTAQEVGLCIPRLPISSIRHLGWHQLPKMEQLALNHAEFKQTQAQMLSNMSPAQSVGSLTAHRDKVPFDRSLGCALGPPEVHSWPAGSVLQLLFRKTCTIAALIVRVGQVTGISPLSLTTNLSHHQK